MREKYNIKSDQQVVNLYPSTTPPPFPPKKKKFELDADLLLQFGDHPLLPLGHSAGQLRNLCVLLSTGQVLILFTQTLGLISCTQYNSKTGLTQLLGNWSENHQLLVIKDIYNQL